MRRPTTAPATLLALCAAAALSGCASPPRHDPGRPVSPAAYDGGVVLAVIGTPFFALAKATSCVASALIAAPTSAGVALTDRPQRYYEREALQEGVAYNCGGPYWLAPAY